MLEDLDVLVTSQEWLDFYLTTELLEGAAKYAHDSWRATKQAARDDPASPYRGWGAVRVKVKDLTPEQLAELGIAESADPNADVYHPLDLPFEDLDSDTRNKNVVPLVVLCNALGDVVLLPDSPLGELEAALQRFIDGSDTRLAVILMCLQHLAFVASEARTGARPYGVAARDDFALYGSLSEDVQEIDRTVLLPVAEWLLGRLQNPKNLALILGLISGRRIVSGDVGPEEWSQILNHPNFNQLEGTAVMAETEQAIPGFWEVVKQGFEYASGVDEVFYCGIDNNGAHRIGFVLFDDSGSTVSEVASFMSQLKERLGYEHQGVAVVMGEIRGSTKQRKLSPTCPTCGIGWSHCRSRRDHQYDVRQAANRRF